MLKRILSAATGLVMLGSATFAGSGAVTTDDVVDFDVLPGWRTATGTHMTALRIQLAPGWKTYWRAPGEAGIPPRFDWAGSKNLSGVAFHWPVPHVFHQNGMRTIGYKDELVLPIELTPKQSGQDIVLRAEVELGVCQDICMPISIRISADLIGEGAQDARISAAMDARPQTAREAGLRGIACSVDAISDGLRLTARIDMPSLGPDEVAVFELPDQTIWVSQADASRQGHTLTASADMVPPNSAPFLLDRSQVRITVLGPDRAVDIWGCNF